MQDENKCRKCEDKPNCNYFIGRFGVEYCDPARQKKVDEGHAKELEERKGKDAYSERKGETEQVKTYKDVIKEQHSK